MASLIQMSEAIESGKIRIGTDGNASGGSIGLPNFDHKNLTDWLHKRNATNAPLNTDYVSLLRKCE
jgi:hypothetical protein